MSNLLREIEAEEVVFYMENVYSPETRTQLLAAFDELKERGVIRSEYSDPAWTCYSGVRTFLIDFHFNHVAYSGHAGKKLLKTADQVTDILKCFCILSCGEFVFSTIQNQIAGIILFLESFGEPIKVTDVQREAIENFLAFICLDEYEISVLLDQIHLLKRATSHQRQLAHLINYMAIENEISDMYESELSDAEFIRWFPIYFWAKITFILPLRATEMLVTPYHCIERRSDGIYLSVRRTMLKKHTQHVYYDVKKDYKIFTYRIPDSNTVRRIEEYQKKTRNQERQYLFVHSKFMVNRMLSLPAFNALLASFIETHLIGNQKYDYSKYASGISEFEVVTAGDSRPIAMSNLYYQDMGADICRQLANHTSINVSYGYFSNVSETVFASSIMHWQRRINRGYADTEHLGQRYEQIKQEHSSCSAPSNPKETGDISECLIQDKLEDCLGCPHYIPSESELQNALDTRKAALDTASKKMIQAMVAGTQLDGADLDKAFLDAHTGSVRYKIACDEHARLESEKWHRYRNTATNC